MSAVSTESPRALTPGLLPRDVPGFTGREHEIEFLKNLVIGGSVLVTAIDGIAGVGKTSLAVHAAHQVRSHFPDGQLYADLRGYTSGQPPAEATEVLEVFLHSLGVAAADVPSGVEARSGLLRGVLAQRRVLMLLDNAISEAQVKPLLPGAGESLVIITSRSTLPGLETDHRISLDVLDVREATQLLTRLIGEERVLAEPAAIQQVRECCGDLPLALRIAAQILAVHQTWPISKLAHLIADERDRLDRLAVGDLDVRVAFELSYRYLRNREARVLRLLGLHPGSSFDLLAAANLANLSPEPVSQTLDQLVQACLISELGPGLFVMHDLLRLFAYEICMKKEKKSSRDAAQLRLINQFKMISLMVAARFSSGPPVRIRVSAGDVTYAAVSTSDALELFNSKRVGMLGALRIAAREGWMEEAWEMFDPMSKVLLLTRRLDDLMDASQIVLSAARRTGNVVIEKDALGTLGSAYYELGRHEDALDCYEIALATLRKNGDRKDEARTLINVGNALSALGRRDDSIANYRNAIKISEEVGDRNGRGQALANLGAVYMRSMRFTEAIPTLEDALSMFKDTGDRRGRGAASMNLGTAHGALGEYDQAIRLYLDAIPLLEGTGDRHTAAKTRLNLGTFYGRIGRTDDAIDVYHQARDVFRSTGDPQNEGGALDKLGDIFYGLRRSDEAAGAWLEAGKIAQESGNYREMARLQKKASWAQSRWRRMWRR